MPELLVKFAGGERRFGAADLPLALGGPDAQVHLPGWGRREPAAFLGAEGAGFFLQPGPLPFPLLRNGAALEGSSALRHEDRLRIGRAELVYHHAPGATHATLVVTGGPAPLAEVEESTAIAPVALEPPPDPRPAAAPRRGFPVGSVLLALFLLVLALAAGFVFSAKTVMVRFDPAPETHAVRGRWPALTLGASRLMLPGEYEAVAIKAGYHPLRQTFTVGREDPQTHSFALRKLPGKVSVVGVSVDPAAPAVAGGLVRLGERVAGPLPVRAFEVEPGPCAVSLSIPEFLPAETNLVVEGLGRAQELRVPLTPDWSMISFTSQPAGAGISVNGVERGKSPVEVKLTQGTYAVRYHLPLHVPFTTQIVVRAHSPFALPLVTLPLSPGRLRITSEPAGANLTTSFLYTGATPAEVEVTANVDHELRFAKAGYEDAVASVRVGPEAVTEKHVVLKELRGEIRFNVTPADAEILVDGVPLAAGLTSAELRATPHAVEIRKEGHVPFSKTVTPRPGFPVVVTATLVPVAPPAPPEPPKEVVTAAGGLKRVQPRDFAAGSPRNEQGRRTNESLRAIKMTRPFLMGEREITNAQFRRFDPAHDSKDYQGRALNEDDRPAVQITWARAAAYCNWLSAQEGLEPAYVEKGGTLVPVEPMTTGYRLPSEAEWEYCARLKDGKPVQRYPWGMDMPPAPKSGNYADLSAKGLIQQHLDAYQDNFATTAPPGQFAANELGLFDLGGNVAEWMHDAYDIAPALEEKVHTDPLGPPPGALHVIKGASWMHGALSRLRLAYRDYGDDARPDVGFRVARYAEPAAPK